LLENSPSQIENNDLNNYYKWFPYKFPRDNLIKLFTKGNFRFGKNVTLTNTRDKL